ncbi:hypothetical protein A9404_01855 [Halothiobacillus diazotrophicus]|uniref:Transporter n=1 Tax=Halothiobacillus diazotrophicus TaxID=1860122 RepID=A0A191ZEJ4_9GAMM|nr:TolC family protein [Halothiobacillus diazotrophicus]ANJ66287.1 hypothetical protein A9404_01855 [Halothiobacillus diazotrophicus]
MIFLHLSAAHSCLRMARIGVVAGMAIGVALLSGCAQYQPIRVPTQPDYAQRPNSDQVSGKPLTLAEIRQRVVRDNADLKAARLALAVQDADVAQAAAPPDPALNLALDHPLNGAGLINALNQSLSVDLSALVTRGARLDEARANRLRTRLGLSWQVLTTEAMAVNAAIELVSVRQQLALLDADAQAVDARLARSRQALAKGFITQDVVSAEVVRSADLARQRDDLRLQRDTLRQQLNALMGLAPATRWPFSDRFPAFATPSDASVREALSTLSTHRADLLALRAGIQRADAAYRAAILRQFPGLTLGLSRANDTSNVQTAGFSIGLTLPVFGGAQAEVARTRATRARMVAEFQARIDRADADVARVRDKLENLRRRLTQIDARLPILMRTAAHAQTALDAGYFSTGSYLAVRASLTAEQMNRIRTRQAIAQTELSLATLLGQSPSLMGAEPESPSSQSSIQRTQP